MRQSLQSGSLSQKCRFTNPVNPKPRETGDSRYVYMFYIYAKNDLT